MYQSEDGLHHQSNITIVLNKEKMQVEDYPRGLTDYEKEDIYNYGYVSHSFHQIARMDGDDLTSVDHGDAYPRSIVLNNMGKGEKGKTITDIRYSENEYLGKYVSGITYRDQGVGAGKAYDLLKIPGGTGENVTGATLGDLQVSDHAYLVCGTSVDQDKAAKDPELQSEQKQNVYLLAMDKETKAVKLSWVTKYENSEDLVNPYLTRLSKNRYMLIWQYKNAVYYREVDGTGRFLTEQNMKKEYRLSDCEPVAVNGKVQWFYTNKKKISFYSIPYEKQEIQLKQPVGIHTGMKENDIKISWEPVTDADGYEIYRSEDGGEFQKIGEQTELSRPGEKATYTDENCRQHVSYAYRIRAYCLDEQGQKKEGPFNAEDVCQICVKKVAVSEVAAVTDGIKISWDQDKDASGYVIYRWEFNSSLEWNYMFYFEKMQKYQVIEAGDITSFVDTNVKSFWMYAYTVAEVYQDTEGDHGSAESYESAGFRRN